MTTLISLAYYETPVTRFNLRYFIQFELELNYPHRDYLIIINGTCSLPLPVRDNIRIIHRDNTGFDLGAHGEGLRSINRSRYQYFILMNAGVLGPCTPVGVDWLPSIVQRITHRVKLVSSSIVCLPQTDAGGPGPHCESFFLVTDVLGLELLLADPLALGLHSTKRAAILEGEYRITKLIRASGYAIECLIPEYQGVDWTLPQNQDLNSCQHPSRAGSFYGKSLNPADQIFHKWYWSYQPHKPVNLLAMNIIIRHNQMKRSTTVMKKNIKP